MQELGNTSSTRPVDLITAVIVIIIMGHVAYLSTAADAAAPRPANRYNDVRHGNTLMRSISRAIDFAVRAGRHRRRRSIDK